MGLRSQSNSFHLSATHSTEVASTLRHGADRDDVPAFPAAPCARRGLRAMTLAELLLAGAALAACGGGDPAAPAATAAAPSETPSAAVILPPETGREFQAPGGADAALAAEVLPLEDDAAAAQSAPVETLLAALDVTTAPAAAREKAAAAPTGETLASATTAATSTTDCTALPARPTIPANARYVTEFGAIPDDDLPDDAAIARAIKALAPGQTLVFPKGRYIQAKSIYVTVPGVKLIGYGATIHATNPNDQTVGLRADNTGLYGFTLTANTVVRGSTAEQSRITVFRDFSLPGQISGVTVRGNTITPGTTAQSANSATAAGILVWNAKNFTIAENTVRRTLADGIHMTGRSNNGRVINNYVRETGDDMIAMVSYLGTGWQNKAKSDAKWLAAAQSGSLTVRNILVQGNDVADQYWGRGISVVGGRNITVTQNAVRNPGRASGVLLAQEGGWQTFGVSNVLVTKNRITNVQTQGPTYLPVGAQFQYLRNSLASQPYTYHGGIEIHAIQNANSTLSDPVLADLIRIKQLRMQDNVIENTRSDGIRVGVDSPAGQITGVSVVSDYLSQVRAKPVNLISNVPQAYCQSVWYDGKLTKPTKCVATTAAAVTGAALNCSAF